MKEFYKMNVEETFKEVSSSFDGIDEKEAEKRLEKNGKNKLKEKKRKSLFVQFLYQFKDLMLIILIIAAVLSAIVSIKQGESLLDFYIIIFVVIMNAILGVMQESKAEKAIDALKDLSVPYVKVKRNGKIESLKSEDIVVGDVVILDTGDAIPADMRVIKSYNLRVEESSLTGESAAVDKDESKIESDVKIPLAERTNMLYFGSNVVYGRAEALVVATGMDTEIGKIAQALSKSKNDITPLQIKINELSRVLSLFVIIIAIIDLIVGLVNGNNIMDVFMLAISLAVAAIPEGLSAVITITLAMGVQKMAKENAIIRKMSSVETLGSTQIICSDKTGTLTQNKMSLRKIYVNKGVVEVDKVENLEDYEKIENLDENTMERLFYVSLLCNDTKFGENLGRKTLLGDPTETCLVEFCSKIELDKEALDDKYPRIDEIPFDSKRKMMTTVNKVGNEENLVCVKGAIESVITHCDNVLINDKVVKLTKKMKDDILNENSKMSSEALRVLALAYKLENDKYNVNDLEEDLIFVGLVGMIDPPRKESKIAVEKCIKAGMIPVMITGDNIETAKAIAKEIGILKDGYDAITGIELDEMSDEKLDKKVENIRVYARVSPENKIRIVDAWKRKNKIVAMTGDGVNDAPALKEADIGVGMGITGTEVSKSVSSMVLADDNFSTIISAVKEGRRIYNNIQNVIAYLLASNIAEVFIIFIATLFNFTILTPIQILWINLITDTSIAIALGFEKEERGIMHKKPRSKDESLFTPFLVCRIIIPAIIKTIIVFVMFFIVKSKFGADIAQATAFSMLCFMEILFGFVCRSDKKTLFKIGILKNRQMLLIVLGTVILQALLIIVPAFGALLKLPVMPVKVNILIFVASLVAMGIFEIVKVVLAKIFKK